VSVWPASAAVVGAGTMGTGFVQLLALAGIDTHVADASEAAAQAACRRAVEQAERFASAGLMPDDAPGRIAVRLTAARTPAEAVAGVDFVIEAVAEDPAVKRAIYAGIEESAPPEAVIASNTSAIPIALLARSFSRPERFLGTHWFNPPQWIPCVELIPGPDTSAAVVSKTAALLRRLGKRPVTVGDSAGFVANRIQFAMFKEAAAVVADGVATAEQVDEIVSTSFGFRLPFFGPFQIADMAGLDVYAGAYRALAENLGDRFDPPPSLLDRVGSGLLGMKDGGGYLPPVDDPAGVTARRDAAYAALAKLVDSRVDGGA
jgi:3-hydroxybutyryl-CoA dehydrogenase